MTAGGELHPALKTDIIINERRDLSSGLAHFSELPETGQSGNAPFFIIAAPVSGFGVQTTICRPLQSACQAWITRRIQSEDAERVIEGGVFG